MEINIDYKKKYNEALEAIKKIRDTNCNNAELISFIEYNFPILKESEDEKIRKALLYYHKNAPEQYTCGGLTNAEVVDWLERQKEQNPEIIIPRFREGDIITSSRNPDIKYLIKKVGVKNELGDYEYLVEGVADNEGRKHSISVDKVDDWGVLVKQDTGNWSKEDEKILSAVIDMVTYCYVNQFAVDVKTSDKARNWLKSLKNIVQPQPKQEWGEEDENNINKLLAICSGAKKYRQFAGCDQELVTKLQNWLKSLKPQPYQNPSQDDLDKAAKEWDRKASFTPIAMTLDSNGNPNGTKAFITTHADSFKAGVDWLIKRQLNKTGIEQED